MKHKLITALVGVASFASGFFVCRAVNKARNRCMGELHIYKITPDQPEEMYAVWNYTINDLKNRKTVVLKVMKGR